ncbi:MAG: hypothetical protein DRO11_03465 [Methanobacteriota archaeon]|nr:MAG: hypothetical protein DRO11_03465 [Euryarchaeota archaeon]
MKELFEEALGFVLDEEGGLTRDSGGLTKYGISAKAFPDLDIENLTLEQAKEIYRKYYWAPFEELEVPPGVRAFLFDSAVNMGVRQAVRFLQRAVSIVTGTRLAVDGIAGPRTREAIGKVAWYDWGAVLWCMAALRATAYGRIVVRRPRLSRYLKGWLRRNLACAAKRWER